MNYLIVILIIALVAGYIILKKLIDKEYDFDNIPMVSISGEDFLAHAEELSMEDPSTITKNSKRKLNKELTLSYNKIIKSYEYIDRDIRNKKEVISASEWLLDNLYLIEKEYKDIKNCSRACHKNLPSLTKGELKGYPRVYHIALEIVGHSDGKVNGEVIEKFISAYQNNSILTSAELWVLPVMLRIALIHNIAKISSAIAFAQKEKSDATVIGEVLVSNIENVKYIEDMISIFDKKNKLSSHFVERILKILRDNGVESTTIYNIIEKNLERNDTNFEKMINLDHQKQATFKLSMGNSINSIREISILRWSSFFEKLSSLEEILKRDPSDVYSKMSFETRDYYRHKIEKYARLFKLPESFIAKQIVHCASEGVEPYERHIGYYLLEEGVNCLKSKIGYKENTISILFNHIKNNRILYYIAFIISSIIILDIVIIGDKISFIPLVLLLVPCSEIIISILNWSINNLSNQRFIPKLELNNGILDDQKTIVIVPTIINNTKRVIELIENLEVYYLANKEKNLFFALLADFRDSNNEFEIEDQDINKEALKKISELNKKYVDGKDDIFFFLNRIRKYNKKEKKYIGWERKRGKIMEFLSLLKGENTSYNIISGDLKILLKAKYIITLDADTILPRDTAKKLIGAMSHILNEPVMDVLQEKVIRGYGVMQPRINISVVSSNKTLYAKLFSGETGIDTYTMAVSDVYQDLFGEGIFTGKGIFNIDVFYNVLKDVFKENSILSHDLIEGAYVNCALVSDIALIDSYPAYYIAASKRLHRWVRGDWQLISWIFKKSPINLLSKWKIIDNLRRSLVAPSIIILLIAAFTFSPNLSEKLFGITILAIVIPLFFDVSEVVVAPIRGISLSGEIKAGGMLTKQIFLIYAFLPYNAYLMIDAIVRTLYRLLVSKKGFLEWTTASDVEACSGKSFYSYIKNMWIGSVIGIVIGMISYRFSNIGFIMMLPSILIWFLSPCFAYYISKDIKIRESNLSKEDKLLLRRISRKTFAYFDDFLNDENNWLAPDNYQEDQCVGIARRTSPTNLAMGITSNIVAYDLGHINLLDFLFRVNKCISAMEGLERYKGHFYNWYDTSNKNPLKPRYISTVDSGNLIGYLWLLNQSIEEYFFKPYFKEEIYNGLEDLLLLCNEELMENNNFKEFYYNLSKDSHKSFDIFEFRSIVAEFLSKVIELEEKKSFEANSLYWNNKLKEYILKVQNEYKKLFPFIELIKDEKEKHKDFCKNINEILASVAVKNIPDQLLILIKNINNNDIYINKAKRNEILLALNKSVEELNDNYFEFKELSDRVENICKETDFSMLFDKDRNLFSIGYDVERDSVGNSYYDLLASEARITSFIAIANGEVDTSHWFKLGRAITVMGKRKGLVSWSGTMFEYLMPMLIMRSYKNTLIYETYDGVVDGQKKYGFKRNVPWGISESAYYDFDSSGSYQYKAHGVPGIGLKRGLRDDLVVSPYSTILAMQIEEKSGIENLKKLIAIGMEGKYGLYEAIDYTVGRIPKGSKSVIIKNYMVHHQGMSIMAIDNLLRDFILQERFNKIPKVKATEILMQERVPTKITYDREVQLHGSEVQIEKSRIITRSFNTAKTNEPEVALLSNGVYSLMVTNSGSGYSKKEDMFISRWKEDSTDSDNGIFFFIKDIKENKYFSATYQPVKNQGDEYSAIFTQNKIQFKRRDNELVTETNIAVSSEENGEVREISITNRSQNEKIIEVTSYSEVTLAPYNSDAVHPAFSNLFIKTEYVDDQNCLLAYRRPRAKNQNKPWLMQKLIVEGESIGAIQYETSRVNFIGRNKNLQNPEVIKEDMILKNTVGAVLDPILSIRKRIKVKPDETVKLQFISMVGSSREELLKIAEKYIDSTSIKRIFTLAETQSQVQLKFMGITNRQANLYDFMAGKILFMSHLYRSRSFEIKSIIKGQSSLWSYGVSGDTPIVLLKVAKVSDIGLVKQMLNAHEYWLLKGIKVDLIILNMENHSYHKKLETALRDVISSSHARDKQNKNSGVYLFNADNVEKEIINLFIAISRIVIDSKNGLMISQIKNLGIKEDLEPLKPIEVKYTYPNFKPNTDVKNLEFFNDYGGFDIENKEYVIFLKDGKNTPAPWINVISNKNFGFHVSESGSVFTWNKNSRENKLTPWNNDWVKDCSGEILYLRDELSGDVWNINPKPIRHENEYIVRNGFGYTTFEHFHNGILSEETMFAPMEENLKLIKIKLKNLGKEKRTLSLTYYAQLVLGVICEQTNTHIYTAIDEEDKFIYGQNPYSETFKNLYAYLKIIGGENESFTGDREGFIGREGTLERPNGLNFKELDNKAGAGFDPCLCENVTVEIAPESEAEFVVIFGQGESLQEIKKNINKYLNLEESSKELISVKAFWEEILGTINVKTPDKAMDIMLNGYLMYQDIACRLWARTAFYQSGGAYGFRDQLQDVMSLCYLKPDITRNQIIYSSSRQFIEGDVQHWWHPIVDSGIRTRFSDDLLWLPYVTADYIKNTGDYSILNENTNYLYDENLKEGEDERYTISKKSDVLGSVYEHCIKAIYKGLNFGSHGLPLMGSGDWNDGMSTVGNEGRGESVWLGWFIYSILNDFGEIAKTLGDNDNKDKFNRYKEEIRENIEKNAWDGNWYRRAYFDDGSPMGSAENDECQIDSLAQTWGIISGGASNERAIEAMKSLESYLIKGDKNMVLLFTPPFENSKQEPGYIKGYIAGVRENGGQYTHASTWVILAYAKLGDGFKAWKTFNMLNPINHTRSYLDCQIYKGEPYVVAADIYSAEGHVGRCGWTWYTGSAGWMYKSGIEGILGLKLYKGIGFKVEPCIPSSWDGFEITYKKNNVIYEITVVKGEKKGYFINDVELKSDYIPWQEKGICSLKVII